MLGDTRDVTRDELENAIRSFIGVIDQIPPKYSAIKVDGKKLYEYARAGKDVDIKSRKICIESFDVLDFGKRYVEEVGEELCYAVVKIICSKGTYIRSLARDIGTALGTGGLMSALVRRRSGAFNIDYAIPLDEIRGMEVSDVEKLIVNTEEALPLFPRVYLKGWEEKLFRNGVPLEEDQWNKGNEEYQGTYLVFGEKEFLGMGRDEDGRLKAEKVLV